MSRGRGRGRERGKADSPLSREPYVGLDLRTPEIMTRAKTRSWKLNRLRHPGTRPSSPEHLICLMAFIDHFGEMSVQYLYPFLIGLFDPFWIFFPVIYLK